MKNYSIFGLSPTYSLLLSLAFALVVGVLMFSVGPEAGMIAPVAALTIEELQTELKTTASEFKSAKDDLTAMQTELKGRYELDGKLTTELKGQIDDMLTKFHGLKASHEEMEQKLAARVKLDAQEGKSIGEMFIESDEFKSGGARLANARGRVGIELKQVNTTAVAGLIRSRREDNVVNLPKERFVMRDLLPTIPIDTNSVDYVKQVASTNNAGPVAEGVAASYSDYSWTNATVSVRRLAHLAKLSRQALEDAKRLRGEVDLEMRYGLGYKEERQLLFGTNVGENLHGIVPQATAFARPTGFGQQTNVNRLDILRVAILQASLALYPADGIILNEMDWAKIEMLKDNDGRYLVGNPNGAQAGKHLWGIRVVNTPAQVAGDFLVGAFATGATIYDRQSTEVEISTENSDDFEKYLATMACAERIALAVKRPGSFIEGDFTSAETLLEAA